MRQARGVVDVEAVQQHLAGERPVEGGAAAQQGGLAGAVRPDQGGDGFGLDGKRDVVERPMPGIVKDQMADRKHEFIRR